MNDLPSSSGVSLKDVREKYRQERDKRLNQIGRGAVELEGSLRRYLDDPFTPVESRNPRYDELDAVCIGAGFAGLLAAARFREAGLPRVGLIDSAGDVGGVWYWNRYPECRCDVDSLIYMPLLEETGYMPTMKYASAPEIGAHARRIARRFDLYDDALFHTTVETLDWDDESARWIVRTDRGDIMRAQFVALCLGPLSKVKLPDIPGVESFKGKSFHTSRWDYDYTGGGPLDSDLDKLGDKTVGFIGTGATGLQCVAPLARSAKAFYLFQRTPATVGVRANGPIEVQDIPDLAPGWQKRRQENFTAINFGRKVDQDLVDDGWTELYGTLLKSPRYEGLTGEALAIEKERVDFEMMERIRQRISSIVEDPDTASKLKPYYNYLCKRAGFHDEYLAAFNLPGAHLVDTQGKGIERITERGVVANGEEFPLDCLIFGTGFEVELAGRLRLGIEVRGKDGIALADKWSGGMSTLHGLTTSGFPNFFIIPGINSQAVVTTNVVHMTQEYAAHIAFIAKAVRDAGADSFDLNRDAEADWVQTIIDRRIDNNAFLEACTPGRRNFEGEASARPIQNTTFGGHPEEYFNILKNWREQGTLPGMTLSRVGRYAAMEAAAMGSASEK